MDLGQNEGRGKVEVEEGRKGDEVDGEGKRGDEEKVYCSGSTAGRGPGLVWVFGLENRKIAKGRRKRGIRGGGSRGRPTQRGWPTKRWKGGAQLRR